MFTNHTYQWAEMIVRAHNKCNLGLLQRSLRIDASAAEALRQSLIRNGIVTAQANAYGIHTATKPLYEGAFMNVSEAGKQLAETVEKVTDLLETPEGDESEIESDINDLDNRLDSASEVENLDAEESSAEPPDLESPVQSVEESGTDGSVA